ncbi:hypothetical protein [Desulfovibrio sp. SGI.169]|uniref:hypothetical protein n=1 Tax=Desulfovibrio sp. SGI.169 TaxID=3420561 RepID=UPI003CFF3DDA
MTIESTLSKNTYTGNGLTTVFPFSFKVWDSSQLKVTISSPDGVITTATGWTADLSDSGGSVTYQKDGSPLPSGWTLAITRDMPFVQNVNLITGSRFDPEVIERALDTATAERQQLLEVASRSIQMPATSSITPEQYGQELLDAKDDAASSAAQAARSAREAQASAAETAEIKAAALREVREEGDAQADRLNDLASGHVLTFEREVERAHDEADRAEDAAERAEQIAAIAQGAENLEATMTLTAALSAGQELSLPITYLVGRNALRLSWEGVELYRGVSFEEVGETDTASRTVRMLLDIPAGNRLNAWSVASNVARKVQASEEAASDAADKARESAAESAAMADAAVASVREAQVYAYSAATQAGVAGDAAQEATEQADRAEEAATDAERAARKAQAAACGKGIAVIRDAGLLEDAPDGFYFVDPSLAVPATCALPLNTAQTLKMVPEVDGFYFIGLDAHCPDPCPSSPDQPSTTLCGRRRKLLAA